ncbi:MAG TPA: TolC family protein [Planctomycetota bacterium]|nr:TolC family protein [Planctomycetota bacterium]
MYKTRALAMLATTVAAACHSYSPAPVDLRRHALEFAARLPDPATLAAFGADAPLGAQIDLQDGIDLREARLLAVLLNPDCRLARLRAGVARIERDHAGRWVDPELGGDFSRILEDVAHPWLAAGHIALTLPLNGRLGLERDLADTHHRTARLAARVAEARTENQLDAAWVGWSAAQQRVGLLREQIERLRQLETIATTLGNAGTLTQLAVRAFPLERLQREGELGLAEAALATAELAIKQLLGLHPEAPVRFLPALAIDAHVEAGQRAQRLFTSPRLLLLQGAHDAAEAALALAVRKQWPDLVLRPGFEEEDAQPRLALGFSLPIPLFSGNDAEIYRAEAERDLQALVLRNGYEALVQELAADELHLAATLRQRALIDTELLPLARQQVADGRRLAELGQLEPLLILDALTRAHQAEVMALDAKLAEAQATIAINSLFWSETTTNPAAETNR